jgi:hypothetical protein
MVGETDWEGRVLGRAAHRESEHKLQSVRNALDATPVVASNLRRTTNIQWGMIS